MNKNVFVIGVALSFVVGGAVPLIYGHCEIPCGIYDDAARTKLMSEHCDTIEKSMKQIVALEQADQGNANQLVRWVINKEEHAKKLQDVATQYFMFQRIKPVDDQNAAATEKYLRELELMHRITVEAMKCKQTTDVRHVQAIRDLLARFEASYFNQEQPAVSAHSHDHDHGHEH